MKNFKTLITLLLLSSAITFTPIVTAGNDEHAHEEENHGEPTSEGAAEHDEAGVVKLTNEQMKLAGVIVKPLQLQKLQSIVQAPGEVAFNTYKTVAITPRITAQLIKRHVVLGEHVKKGQAIATLSSVEMAEAQGNVLVTYQEWRRVKKLGKKIVAERRYIEAQIKWELAKAKARAYGMTQGQIDRLVKSRHFSRANGRFDLVALIGGTILKEDYIVGQQIEPGQELNVITDESSLWVMANVAPAIANQITVGNKATVQWGELRFPATVSQIYHNLDEVTRTSRVRLSVENKNDSLHAGLFVETQIEISTQKEIEMVVLVPEHAVLRSPDGDWQVLVEQDEAGEFKGVEVELLDIRNGQAIIQGLAVGTPVVVNGAFFVQSELAKSGFEIHNH
jgi:RND family efflux transporter MFP subunit